MVVVKSQFRPTPSELLVPRVPAARLSMREVPAELEFLSEADPVELPEEAVLRLLASLDLDDLEAVSSFVEVTGMPDPTWSRNAVTQISLFDKTALDDVQRAVRYYIGPDSFPHPWRGFEPHEGRDGPTELAAVWNQRSLDDSDLYFVAVLNTYLCQRELLLSLLDEAQPLATSPVALCTQLYNLWRNDAAIHVCQNENCRRPFSKHLGRSAHGQHRSRGVKYCSKNCTNAQEQRDRRKRRRAQEATSS